MTTYILTLRTDQHYSVDEFQELNITQARPVLGTSDYVNLIGRLADMAVAIVAPGEEPVILQPAELEKYLVEKRTIGAEVVTIRLSKRILSAELEIMASPKHPCTNFIIHPSTLTIPEHLYYGQEISLPATFNFDQTVNQRFPRHYLFVDQEILDNAKKDSASPLHTAGNAFFFLKDLTLKSLGSIRQKMTYRQAIYRTTDIAPTKRSDLWRGDPTQNYLSKQLRWNNYAGSYYKESSKGVVNYPELSQITLYPPTDGECIMTSEDFYRKSRLPIMRIIKSKGDLPIWVKQDKRALIDPELEGMPSPKRLAEELFQGSGTSEPEPLNVTPPDDLAVLDDLMPELDDIHTEIAQYQKSIRPLTAEEQRELAIEQFIEAASQGLA